MLVALVMTEAYWVMDSLLGAETGSLVARLIDRVCMGTRGYYDLYEKLVVHLTCNSHLAFRNSLSEPLYFTRD